MTIYEAFKNKSIDELSEWLDKYLTFDNAPHMLWFDENYCSKCASETRYVEVVEREMPFAWCELNDNKCKFFHDMDEVPDTKQIIKMWLNSDIENLNKYLQ